MICARFNSIKVWAVLVLFAVPAAGLGQGRVKEPAGFLPRVFSGWQIDGKTVKSSSDPAASDPADFAVLKEYGFGQAEAATYRRSGREMQIKAARFNDATGAYGAFTYYVQPQMRSETIGDKAVSNNTRILFYKGNILVDVSLEHMSAMSAADLRALADALPHPQGNLAALPTLPGNVPAQSLLPNTSRYIVGPEAMARLGVPIPAQLVDFSKSAEVEYARYRTSQGEAALTLIGYPTPQLAREKMTAMQAASLPGGPFYFRRSGPFVVAVNGSIPPDEAQSLLASVNYDADVTWNQATKNKPPENRAGFIVALILLCILVILAALIFGFAFGGLRILLSRLFPNTIFTRAKMAEIIRLDLKERS
ncbi:MAG TPA: DUF6599 family protein [Candidatus Angelobacter sp.]|nr:DUF6599 family protein [Candidatus Angelobacter sp.]